MLQRAILPSFLLAQLLSGAVVAEDKCSNDPRFRQFDFWLGHWRVTDASNGAVAGHNRISRLEGDCALLEQWQSISGGSGTSIHYFSPVSGQWRQVWLANGYNIDISGGLQQGAMVLEGTIEYYQQGVSLPFRGRWQQQADGTVLQYFSQFDNASQQWQDWFRGVYTLQADNPAQSSISGSSE